MTGRPRHPADTRVDFVPMVGVEQDIVDLMHRWLEPVGDCSDETGAVMGQEQCAKAIVEMLRQEGIEL